MLQHTTQSRQVLGALILAAVLGGGVQDGPSAVPSPAPAEIPSVYDALGTRLAPLSAQIVTANAEVEQTLQLLARVEVQANEVLEFYEAGPGLLVITAAGAPTGPSRVRAADLTALQPTEVWDLVAPSTPMPDALRQALERLQPSGAAAPQSPPPDPAHERAGPQALYTAGLASQDQDPSTLTAGWCDTSYFTGPLGLSACEGDFTVCLDNWWNGAYAYHHEAARAFTTVCPAQGSVVFKVQTDVGLGGIWTVPQHTYRYWYISVPDCDTIFNWTDCPYVRADVTQASGDRFHFRFLVWE
jgi:hypothetical protein